MLSLELGTRAYFCMALGAGCGAVWDNRFGGRKAEAQVGWEGKYIGCEFSEEKFLWDFPEGSHFGF